MGPLGLFLGRRAGIRTARADASRATFGAVLHRGARFDRRERSELEDLVGNEARFIAATRPRRHASARAGCEVESPRERRL